MITIHSLDYSRAHRILWLCDELSIPYEVVHYQRDANFMAPAALKKIHPLGKSPVITDGDLTLAESGAIMEFLMGRYGDGGLVPDRESSDWPKYLYYLHSAEGSAMPLLVNKLVFDEIPRRSPAIVRPLSGAIAGRISAMLVDRTLPDMFDEWERDLAVTGWFAGRFSAADIMMGYTVEVAADRAGITEGHLLITEWIERIRARPAYRTAAERGGFRQAS